MRTLGIIVASIVSPALLPIVIVGAMARHAEPLDPPSGHPTALYWADRIFVSKAEFAAWLESRGVTYKQWVGRHPGASPWERRAASPVRPANPTAGREATAPDRRATEERPLGERLRALLGNVRSALVPAMVVLFVAVVLAVLARSRRAVGEFAAAALHATRARLRGAAPSPPVLAGLVGWSRMAEGGARPAMAADGAPRLSLALEPVPAVGPPTAGAPWGVLRRRGARHPSGSDQHAQDVPRVTPAVRPVEPELRASAPPPAVDDVAEAPERDVARQALSVAVEPEPAPAPAPAPADAEVHEPDRTADAPRLRPVYRPVARPVAPAQPLQRWRPRLPRPLRADTSVPVAPEPVPPPTVVPKQEPEPPARAAAADEAREPVALEPRLAVAAEQKEEAPDALLLDDQTVMCTIAVWHGYVKSRFYARVSTPDGETHTVAESPMFRRRGAVPEALPDVVSAHEALLDHLRAEGWRPVGSLGAWYAICLQQAAPAVMSIPR